MKKLFLNILAFVLFPVCGTWISVRMAYPNATHADQNWDGLMFSPGDMILLRAGLLGLLGGLLIGVCLRQYVFKRRRA